MAVTYSQNGVIVRNTGFDVIGGKKYKIARMPDGKIWLAENLDFKFCTIGGSGTPTTANAWYYNNDETTYGWSGYKCGLLYNWYAIKFLNDNRSELCPGWHVPTSNEWSTLATSCGGSIIAGGKLKALDGSFGTNWPSNWNGTNNYEFNIIPTGGRLTDGSFQDINSVGSFWTIDMNNNDAINIYLLNNSDELYYSSYELIVGTALRLVRDA